MTNEAPAAQDRYVEMFAMIVEVLTSAITMQHGYSHRGGFIWILPRHAFQGKVQPGQVVSCGLDTA